MPASQPLRNVDFAERSYDTQSINPGASHAHHSKLISGKHETANSAPLRNASSKRNPLGWPDFLKAVRLRKGIGNTRVFGD